MMAKVIGPSPGGKRMSSWKVVALLGLAGLVSVGCTPDFAEQGDAPVILRILKITGVSGHNDEEGDFLISDVRFEGSVFNDNALIDFEVITKNPAVGGDLRFQDVLLTQYEVRYIRTDGRDEEGVDVPFRFTGAMATLVPANDEASAAVIVVRHQAKREPPLTNIAEGGGPRILSLIAEITVHGQTTAGKAVRASGRLQIQFADFADE